MTRRDPSTGFDTGLVLRYRPGSRAIDRKAFNEGVFSCFTLPFILTRKGLCSGS